MRRLKVIFIAGLAFVALAVLALWLAQRRLIYLPFGDVPAATTMIAAAEEVTFSTADGLTLGGWFVPVADPRATVIVCSGNAGNRSYRATLALRLAGEGYAVLLFDYRGYGGNPGHPSEEGLRADARAAREYLLTRDEVDADRLVYYGESLGGAVAVALAAEHPPAALILRSPFSSMVDVARLHYPFLPVSLLLRDRWPSIDRIAEVEAPTMVVAGDRDRIVPTRLSRRLFDAIPTPDRYWLEMRGVGHNDPGLTAGPELVDAVDEFLRKTLAE